MPRSRRGNAGVPPQRLGEEEREIEETNPNNPETAESESEQEAEGAEQEEETAREAEDTVQEERTTGDEAEIQHYIRTAVQNTIQDMMPTLLAQLGNQPREQQQQDRTAGASRETERTTPTHTPAVRETPYAGRRLNLADKIDHQLFNNALKPLSDTPFDGKEHFATFIHRLADKCRTLHCEGIFHVPTSTRGVRNLLSEYGEIDLNDVQRVARARWAVANWNRQASYIIGRSLLSSVTADFHMRLMLKADLYTVPTHNEIDGPALFKVICTMVNPAGRNNTRILLTKLEKFRPAEVQNNIVEFNSRFLTLKMEVSAAQGGQGYIHGDHLYNILMDAYESVNQDDFNDWIRHRNNTGRVSYDTLMNLAEDRYNTLVQEGKWDLPSQQDQFLAFAASTSKAIASIKKAVDSRKQGRDKKRNATTSPAKHQKQGTEDDKIKKKAPTNAEYKAWCAKAPKKGEEGKLVWHMTPSGVKRQFNWCKYHNRMVVYKDRQNRIHTSETCTLAPQKGEGEDPPKAKALKVKALKGLKGKPKQLQALQAQIQANLQDLEALQAEIGTDDASSASTGDSSSDESAPDSADE